MADLSCVNDSSNPMAMGRIFVHQGANFRWERRSSRALEADHLGVSEVMEDPQSSPAGCFVTKSGHPWPLDGGTPMTTRKPPLGIMVSTLAFFSDFRMPISETWSAVFSQSENHRIGLGNRKPWYITSDMAVSCILSHQKIPGVRGPMELGVYRRDRIVPFLGVTCFILWKIPLFIVVECGNPTVNSLLTIA